MPTLSSTLANLRQGFMEYLGEWVSFTASGAGNAGGTTYPDATNLVNYANDYFNTWWSLLTSGTYSGQVRRVSDFVQTSGTVTVLSAYGGQVASGVSYELLHYHPTVLIRWALNRALQEIYPVVYRSIRNEALITANALPNGSFEDWASASVPDHWVTSVVTAAKETGIANIRNYKASLKVTGGASSGYVGCEVGTSATTYWPDLLDLAGYSIDFEAWCKSDTASHARLQIVDDDGTSSSDWHTGGNTFELLKVTRSIKAGTKQVAFRCVGAVNTAVAYYEGGRAIGGVVSKYALPAEFILGHVEKVSIQQSSGELTGDERPCDDIGWLYQPQEWQGWDTHYDDRLGIHVLSFSSKPPWGYKIKLEGKDPITKLSADTDTVPLVETQLNMLYPYAAYRLFMALGNIGEANIRLADYKELVKKHAMPVQPKRLQWVGVNW